MKCENTESLGRLIYLAAQEIKNFAEKLLKPYDLTLEQLHLLKGMSKDSAMSQRELGEQVDKTPANMTRILDRLESKNLVIRRHSQKDRRASQVFLTEQGHALVQEVFATFESFSSQLTQGITEQQQQRTREVLNRIEHNIKTMAQITKSE